MISQEEMSVTSWFQIKPIYVFTYLTSWTMRWQTCKTRPCMCSLSQTHIQTLTLTRKRTRMPLPSCLR